MIQIQLSRYCFYFFFLCLCGTVFKLCVKYNRLMVISHWRLDRHRRDHSLKTCIFVFGFSSIIFSLDWLIIYANGLSYHVGAKRLLFSLSLPLFLSQAIVRSILISWLSNLRNDGTPTKMFMINQLSVIRFLFYS